MKSRLEVKFVEKFLSAGSERLVIIRSGAAGRHLQFETLELQVLLLVNISLNVFDIFRSVSLFASHRESGSRALLAARAVRQV